MHNGTPDIPSILLNIVSRTGKPDFSSLFFRFFPLFSTYIYKLCSDVPSLVYTTDHVLASFAADGVVYLELRTTPRAIPEQNISKADYVDLVLSRIAAYNAKADSQMHTTLILSIDRRNTLEEANEVVELAISRMRQGVVGVDLCGNPARELTPAFGTAFEKAKLAGLKVTLHFAEAPSSSTPEELRTLLSWRPDRLGHVIHVDSDGLAVRDEIVRRRIGVELCLSCNVKGRLISGEFADHHFGWWKDSGVGVALGVSSFWLLSFRFLPFLDAFFLSGLFSRQKESQVSPLITPNPFYGVGSSADGLTKTDDVGVFLSPLSEEYYLAAQHFNLSKADIRRLCEGTIDVIFGSEQEKERLRSIYADWPGWL